MISEGRVVAHDVRELHEGLEGVLVAETRLSHVDGQRGRLVIAGSDVEELAARCDIEQATTRLWSADAELAIDANDLRRVLAEGRVRAFRRIPSLGGALRLENSMDALRAAVAQLPEDVSAVELLASLPVFAAAAHRTRSGAKLIPPDLEKRHAEDILSMLGSAPDPDKARALDAYLVSVIDHGLNASTFAARVVASTGSDRVSAVVAALGALKGPLHGGAPGPVLDMLDAIGLSGAAEAYLRDELARGRRIMGMGHRIYRVRDPRALTLECALEALAQALAARAQPEDAAVRARLSLARSVEREAESLLRVQKPERALRANVEFYTAVLLEAVGVPRSLFTPLFAAGRCAGWLAHVAEQRARGRLIRPASRYVGPLPARATPGA